MADMRFRTEITPSPSPIPLSPDSRVVMLGSCFTDNIGTRLADSGVPVSANVCGVLYNPASIAEAVTTALDGEWSGDLEFRHDALYRNWLLSTKFAHADADTARTLWHSAFATLHKEIMCADMLIITFGTAWVFTHIASASSQYSGIVGNCHKVPAREFQRRRLSVDEITDLWQPLIARLKRHSPELRIVFTISPIRHFKDGAHGNTLSKATLHLATDMLTYLCPGTEYFPAYELLVDDLRDYRFYAADMLHPSDVAADYVWQHFTATYFTTGGRAELARRAAAIRASRHRPITGGNSL